LLAASTGLHAKTKASAFYVSSATQTEAAPVDKAYFLIFANQETSDVITSNHRNELVIKQVMASKGWHPVEDKDEASLLLELKAYTIDRHVTIKAQVSQYNNAAAKIAGRHALLTGNTGPSGLQTTEALIGPDGAPVVVGQGDTPDQPEPETIEKVVPEKHLSLRAYNVENFSETNEVAIYVDVDTVNREENIDMENCIGTLLQLACSYAEKQTDGYLTVNLKK